MKRILAGLTVAVCVFGAAGLAWAQAEQPPLHVVVSYFKVAPGMQDAYRDHLVNVSKKNLDHFLAALTFFSPDANLVKGPRGWRGRGARTPAQ